MKKAITILAVLIQSGILYSQQIGTGTAPLLTTENGFNKPVNSGVYVSGMPQEGFPEETPEHPWKYLVSIRSTSAWHQQLQIAGTFWRNDRLFFRKIEESSLSAQAANPWYELATRGDNHFTGKQIINGDLQVGYNNYASAPGYGKRLFFGDEWENSKPLWIARYNAGTNMSEMRVNIGSYPESNNRFVVGTTRYDNNEWLESLSVLANGNVGIGISNPGSKLELKK